MWVWHLVNIDNLQPLRSFNHLKNNTNIDFKNQLELVPPSPTKESNGIFKPILQYNPNEIPTQLTKVSITPDKTEIKKQLKAGIKIDGAELVTGAQTISIRTK